MCADPGKKINYARCIFTLGVFSVFCLMYFVPKMSPYEKFVRIPFFKVIKNLVVKDKTGNNDKNKTVHFFKRRSWYPLNMFKNCPQKCEVIDDQGKMNSVDALVFMAQDLKNDFYLKKRRGQIWIFLTMESPNWNRLSYHRWSGLFNWTMHYRRDSDIMLKYGNITLKSKIKKSTMVSEEQHAKDLMNHWIEKPQAASWMVSKCSTPSRRMWFSKHLRSYIPVGIYGKCGPLKCPRSRDSKCWEKLNENYQYYLSFENAFCRDYLTEKIFNPAYDNFSLIPIVRGGSNYKYFLPPWSYINTRDFKSVRELGVHLMNLYRNNSYAKHFKYKQYYKATPVHRNQFCKLCSMLHSPEKYLRYYEDIDGWYRGTLKRKICKIPKEKLK